MQCSLCGGTISESATACGHRGTPVQRESSSVIASIGSGISVRGAGRWFQRRGARRHATQIDTIRVRPDDGQGHWYSWEFDALLLGQGTNSFYFAVRPDAEYSNGIAIYGRSLVDDVDDALIVIEFDV